MTDHPTHLDSPTPADTDHRSAAHDSLLGLATGDAYGAQHFVPENAPLLREQQLPPTPWPWTDDTEMACSLLAVLRLRGSVQPWDLADSFARRHDFDRGYGPAMNRMLRQVRQGGHWEKLAQGLFDGQGSWGNGAAMRVAPLGAWFAVDLEETAWQAARSARVTHVHPEAVAGAVAVAVAAACAARSRGSDLSAREFLAVVRGSTPAGRVRDGVDEAIELVDEPYPELAAHRLGNGSQVSAVDTVPFALWSAARHLDDYPAALRATASVGGDVDTTCAIVGGIVAARLGAEGIPPRWREATEPLPDWVDGDRLGTDLRRGDLPEVRPLTDPRPLPVPDLSWGPGQWQRVRHGVRAQSTDERWDVLLEGERLLFMRSGTGLGVFEVEVAAIGAGWRPLHAWVESNRECYRRGTDEAEAALLELLLEQYFGHELRPELWARYKRLRFGG